MLQTVFWKKFSWLFWLALLGTQFFVALQPHKAFAYPLSYSAPTDTSYFIYVTDGYGRYLDGTTIYRAYRQGYDANLPGQTRMIVLDFGRQIYNPVSGNWGIQILFTHETHSLAWVSSVAQNFINGYNDNPAHQSAIIAIGINNANVGWTCSNNSNIQTQDSKWYTSGERWASMVTGLTPGSRVSVASANDIEAWIGLQSGWVACAGGTLRWFDGYQHITQMRNYNFGSNGNAEASNTWWTIAQVYDVSWGRLPAYVLPQIYCSSANATPWVAVYVFHSMLFNGVTSDNHRSTICNNGSYTLTWQNSWSTLNTALTSHNPSYPNALLSTAISPRNP